MYLPGPSIQSAFLWDVCLYACVQRLQLLRLLNLCDRDDLIPLLDILEPIDDHPAFAPLSRFVDLFLKVSEGFERACADEYFSVSISMDESRLVVERSILVRSRNTAENPPTSPRKKTRRLTFKDDFPPLAPQDPDDIPLPNNPIPNPTPRYDLPFLLPFHGDTKDLQHGRFPIHPRLDDGWEEPGNFGADEFDQAVNDGFRV